MAILATRFSGAQLTPQAACPIPATKNGIWVDSGTPNVLKFRLTGGTDTSLGAGGGGSSTLATAYTTGASQTDSTISLDSTRLGVVIKDNATPVGNSLFRVANAANTIFYLDASVASGLGVGGSQAIGTAQTSMMFVSNVTPAAVGAQQFSPMLTLIGKGWGTTAGTSQTVQWGLQTRPVQGLVPTGDLVLWSSIAGGSFTETFAFQSGGGLTTPANLVVTSAASATNTTGTTINSNVADGASSIGLVINNATTLSSGKLVSVRNNGTEAWKLTDDGTTTKVTAGRAKATYVATGGSGLVVDEAGSTASIATFGFSRFSVDNGANAYPTSDLSGRSGTSTNRWTETWSRRYAGVEQTVAAAATISLDPAAGETIRVTLSATAITTINAGTGYPGEVMRVEVIQDGTGSRSISGWSASFVLAGGAYTATATASKRDVLTFMYDATATKWFEQSRSMNL